MLFVCLPVCLSPSPSLYIYIHILEAVFNQSPSYWKEDPDVCGSDTDNKNHNQVCKWGTLALWARRWERAKLWGNKQPSWGGKKTTPRITHAENTSNLMKGLLITKLLVKEWRGREQEWTLLIKRELVSFCWGKNNPLRQNILSTITIGQPLVKYGHFSWPLPHKSDVTQAGKKCQQEFIFFFSPDHFKVAFMGPLLPFYPQNQGQLGWVIMTNLKASKVASWQSVGSILNWNFSGPHLTHWTFAPW